MEKIIMILALGFLAAGFSAQAEVWKEGEDPQDRASRGQGTG